MHWDSLSLTPETLAVLQGHLKKPEDLLSMQVQDILNLDGVDLSMARELREKLKAKHDVDLPLLVSQACILNMPVLGRPIGAKDKEPDKLLRANVGRENSWRNGNGSHATDDFSLKTSHGYGKEIEAHRILWEGALKGHPEDLESEFLTKNFAMMSTLLEQAGEMILNNGGVEVPIYRIGSDGEILRDDRGVQVVKSIKSFSNTVNWYLTLHKACGVDASQAMATAKSQGRKRIDKTQTLLDDVEKAKLTFDEAKDRFYRNKS